jgi:WD40 repeat protein
VWLLVFRDDPSVGHRCIAVLVAFFFCAQLPVVSAPPASAAPNIAGPEGSVMAVAFSPPTAGRAQNRIAAGDSDYTVRLWDADSSAAKEMGAPLRGHQIGVISVAFTPWARCIVSGSMDGTVRIWPNAPTATPRDALRDKLA